MRLILLVFISLTLQAQCINGVCSQPIGPSLFAGGTITANTLVCQSGTTWITAPISGTNCATPTVAITPATSGNSFSSLNVTGTVVQIYADNAITNNDYLGYGVTTGGYALDLGSSLSNIPSTTRIIGQAIANASSGALASVQLNGQWGGLQANIKANSVGQSQLSTGLFGKQNATSALLSLKPAISGVVPTITLSAGGASSTITNPTVYQPANSTTGLVDNNHFLYVGCQPLQSSPGYPGYSWVISTPCITGLNESPLTIAEMMVDSGQFEIILPGQGERIRILIDGVEAINTGADTITGTTQAGTSSTITLASGSSATNGIYNQQMLYTTGGTGSGQGPFTITGYVGSTKAATVTPSFTTTPDATTTYRVNPLKAPFAGPANSGSIFNLLFQFGASSPYIRAVRRVRVESNVSIAGIRVDSSGSIWKPVPQTGVKAFVLGDSFTEPTGSSSADRGWAYLLCELMGWEEYEDGSGGTGIIAGESSTGRLNYQDRALPPVNSWVINNKPLTAQGTFTVTQGGITSGSVATNASYSTLQSALNTAFGSGAFLVAGHPYYGFVLIGKGTNATVTSPLAITTSGATGAMTAFQYTGDIAPYVPKDNFGNALPFVIVVEGSGNDDGQSGLQAAASALYSGLVSTFPTATVVATGRWMNIGPETGSALTTNGYLSAASVASLPSINGASAFVNLFNTSTGIGYLNGTTNIGAPSGASGINTDAYVYYDGTHPYDAGHLFLANTVAAGLYLIFRTL